MIMKIYYISLFLLKNLKIRIKRNGDSTKQCKNAIIAQKKKNIFSSLFS